MPDVFAFDALGPFTEKAVLSRSLLKKPGGSATLFAFAAGEGLSEHTSTSEALAVVLEGEIRFALEGVSCSVGVGEAIRLPATVPHALHAEMPSRMLLFLLT